jgi:hypothetical protein
MGKVINITHALKIYVYIVSFSKTYCYELINHVFKLVIYLIIYKFLYDYNNFFEETKCPNKNNNILGKGKHFSAQKCTFYKTNVSNCFKIYKLYIFSGYCNPWLLQYPCIIIWNLMVTLKMIVLVQPCMMFPFWVFYIVYGQRRTMQAMKPFWF